MLYAAPLQGPGRYTGPRIEEPNSSSPHRNMGRRLGAGAVRGHPRSLL